MAAEVRIEHSYPAAWAFVQEHGPEAIAVLHDLLARAEVDGDRLIVVASVRQVAERLGFLSKDTVHRRVRQLQRARVLQRFDPSSRFACPRYVIDVSGTGIALLMSPAVEPD